MRLKKLQSLYAKHRQMLLYVFFGGCTTAVSIGSFVLFDAAGINELLANVLSWILAVGFAYVSNRIWVFTSQAQGAAIGKELLSFYAGRLFTLAVEEGLLLVFATWLAWNATGVKITAQLAVLTGNYAISKWIIFREKKA